MRRPPAVLAGLLTGLLAGSRVDFLAGFLIGGGRVLPAGRVRLGRAARRGRPGCRDRGGAASISGTVGKRLCS
ncbi:hypothetical protein [Streptosporangium vulgare]|uniref:Glycine transporter domain-containing protein n=1 Tax=Streptosporangium vulgare TaxID=46190 RepID=A0ABV5TDG3_9ACTN